MRTPRPLTATFAASFLSVALLAPCAAQTDLADAMAAARELVEKPEPFDRDAAMEALDGGRAQQEAVDKAIASLTREAGRDQETKEALMDLACAFWVNWWRPVNAMKSLAPLASTDSEVQEFMLRVMRDPPSTTFLQDPNQRLMRRTETVRIAMRSLLPLYALDERVRGELLAVFDSEEPEYALVAVEVFSSATCADPLVQERMLKALGHPRWWVRSNAVRALGCAVEDKSVRSRLAAMLGDRRVEHSAYVREAAVRLLKPYCHEPEVAEGMRSALDHQWGGGHDPCGSQAAQEPNPGPQGASIP